jgi:succinate dehydrogenase / fumarate reductase membrane anchor subunit
MALTSFEKGATHFKHQRLTALALVFLLLFFLGAIVFHQQSSYIEIVVWLKKPYIATLLMVTLVTLFYHSFLGIRVIVEDYVHTKHLRQTLLFLSLVTHVFLASLSVFLIVSL